jgi:hypothetical protein
MWKNGFVVFIEVCSNIIITDVGFIDGFISNKYLRKRIYVNRLIMHKW